MKGWNYRMVFFWTLSINDPYLSKFLQFGLPKPTFPPMSGFMQSTTSPTVRRGGGVAPIQVGTFDDLPSNIFSAAETPDIFKTHRDKNQNNFMQRPNDRYNGGWNTEWVWNSSGNPLFGFPMLFCFEQSSCNFFKNHWKFEQNGLNFVQISNGSVFFKWLGP